MWRVWAVALFLLTGVVTSASAVEVAPRVSDREIIESLVELRSGQKAFQQQLDEVKGQIAELRQSTQQQLRDLRQDMNQRFQDMNQRLNDVMMLLQILIGVLALVLGGMLAWLIAVWRRVVQVEERQKAFELQGDEIKFLREGYGRLQEMFIQLLERSGAPR